MAPVTPRVALAKLRARRGFSILELLVSLGILLALFAIALPIVAWTARLAPIESAREQVNAIVQQSAAHARSTGRPIELHLVEYNAKQILRARWFDPTAEDDALLTIGQSWARWNLPSDVRAFDDIAYDEFRDSIGPFSSAPPEDAPRVSVPPIRFAIALPDGTMVVGDALTLRMTDPRTNKAWHGRVDAWSAAVAWTQLDETVAPVVETPQKQAPKAAP